MPHSPTTPQPNRPTWIEMDRSALINNIERIRAIIGPKPLLTAVVKANAYGHGVRIVGPIAQAAGVDRFAVASLSEGVELRRCGVTRPILVLGYTPPRLVTQAIRHDIQLTIYDRDAALAFDAVASDMDHPATVHVKVNTGMNRLGVTVNADTGEALALFEPSPIWNIWTSRVFSPILPRRIWRTSERRKRNLLVSSNSCLSWKRMACVRRWLMPPTRRPSSPCRRHIWTWFAPASPSMAWRRTWMRRPCRTDFSLH